MPCLLVLLIVLFPRVAIALLYFLTNYFSGVFDTVLVPLLGFIFLPLSLLAYTYLTKSGQPVNIFYLIVMFVAVILDFGLVGGGARSRYRR